LLLISFRGTAQTFADQDYYLIDSLDLTSISISDSLLIDSCLSVFYAVKEDTLKTNAIKEIVEQSWDDNVWPRYNQWLYEHVQIKLKEDLPSKVKRNLLFSYASTINNIGYLNSSRGNFPEALKYYDKSLELQLKLGDKDGAATSYNNIGAINNKQGDVLKALNNYHKSLDIYAELKNELGMAGSFNNIGHIYQTQNEPDLSLKYLHKSLDKFKSLKHKRGIATLVNSIGFLYFIKKENEKALTYYDEALALRYEIGDRKGAASTLNNIATVYENQNNIEKAMEQYEKCLKLYEVIDAKSTASTTYNNIGRLHLHQGRLKEAEKFSLKGMSLARQVGHASNLRGSAKTLSSIYEEMGEGMKALQMHKLFITMRDSIINEETQVSTIKEQTKYEYEMQKTIDDANHDKLITIKEKEKEKQKVISIALILGLIIVVVFLFFVFNRLKVTKKQKLVIEAQNNEIVDSITYAKRIQSAILPSQKLVQELLPDSFIIYKPKDIVAGDFYWLEHKENKVLFAAADCTGHGVPGAMVSVVCNNGLNRSVREHGLIDPGLILDKTREIIVQEFEKSEEEVNDGMDIAICAIEENELKYAGAHNPLWIVKKGKEKVLEIKANKQPIGKFDKKEPYTTHSLKLEKGDSIYIFSDGYADQFGGEKGKKFKTANFKKLLLSIQKESMAKQKEIINRTFETWKGDLEQLDDVCVIGVRV